MAGFILLSAAQMRAVEAATIKGGVSSAALMEKAGEKVAGVAMQAWSKRPVTIVCGPGNNGGDGFVAARRLAEAGWPVTLGLIGARDSLAGDAKLMADLYEGDISPFTPATLEGAGLIIDAIFGTGLARIVEGDYRAAIEAINAHPAPVLAVDIPSGVDADTGAVLGVGVEAVRTVTFFQKNPGHVLFPGRALCGSVDAVDIGITRKAATTIKPDCFENQPSLWGGAFGRPGWQSHKYDRGHVMAVSGGALQTGAIRLAAMGALRIGAGVVTVLSPRESTQTHAAHLTAIMLRPADNAEEIRAFLQGDKYPMTVIIGPASGIGETTRDKALAILKSPASAVLDADALTSFADDPAMLFSALREGDVLTPHTGEFERLFDGIALSDGKLTAARAASKKAGCIIVLKGADTVIAAPDGRAAININAPTNLATAGAGDVLAGFIAGLRAQAMPGFEAACAGVWFHGACAQAAGPGMIAEDLPVALRPVLQALLAPPKTEAKETSIG